MAKGSLNLKVSKADFVQRIELVDNKMKALDDVIQRYGEARKNLDQFVEQGDSTYEAWLDRIDANVDACKRAKASLQETKLSLEKTVEQMEGMSSQLKETISAGAEAASSVVKTTIKVASVL